MFVWDYSAIITLVVFVLLGIVFAMWMAYTFNKAVDAPVHSDEANFRQCHYCGYVYIDHLVQSPCRCPRCLSYHDL